MPMRHAIRTTAQMQARSDPYYEWARATNFTHLFAPGVPESERLWLPLMIQTQRPKTAADFANGNWNPPPDWKEWLRIPELYAKPSRGLARTTFCTATVTSRFFEELGKPGSSLSTIVRRVKLGLPLPPPRPPSAKPPTLCQRLCAVLCTIARWFGRRTAAGGATRLMLSSVHDEHKTAAKRKDDKYKNKKVKGKGVVVGVIDDGLAFAHEQFRNGNGTRIEFFWNQDGPESSIPDSGWELDKAAIDTELARFGGGLVDEDQIYRRTGHMVMGQAGHKPIAWRAGHGTHVMDLASGFDPGKAPKDRPLVCVQLPVAATADSSGATLEPYAYHALRYIIDRAGELPVVVNLSYGFIAGPHDGSGFLEEAMDEAIFGREAENLPLAIVLPSGNSFLSRCHARFSLANPPDSTTLRWRILPDDTTPSYLEIWLPHPDATGAPQVTVQVTSPNGVVIGPVGEGGVDGWELPDDLLLCEVVYYDTVGTGRNRNMILITVAPTTQLESTQRAAPSGVWSIQVQNAGANPIAEIDAWIERDDAPYGYPRAGRQSYFDDPDYRHFDGAGREIEDDNVPMSPSYVKRDGTINSIATGEHTIVMGGFRRKWADRSYFSNQESLIPAKDSASGRLVAPPPPSPPYRIGPDAMTVSQDAAAYHGVLAAGARSGSAVAMHGTSMAAPQITRWIADQMAAGNPHHRSAVWALAQLHEGMQPPPNPQPQPERMGEGRITFPPHVLLDRFER